MSGSTSPERREPRHARSMSGRATNLAAITLRGCAALLAACALAACAKTPVRAPANGLVVQNPFGDRPTFFDFGTVAYGAKLEHTFQLENSDPAPLTILDMI